MFMFLQVAMASVSAGREWRVQSYTEQEETVWPKEGRFILAQYDQDSIVVYQAYCPEIADFAVKNQRYVKWSREILDQYGMMPLVCPNHYHCMCSPV